VIHLDTSFLIDLSREAARERPGPAFDLIETLEPSEILAVSVHVVCELRAGAELSKQPIREGEAVDQLLSGVLIVYPDDRFASEYARLVAATTRGSHPVATFDLLIATAALLDDARLVTKHLKDFSRVPGLRLLGY
jgi:predicted nucleic acid-binding protein